MYTPASDDDEIVLSIEEGRISLLPGECGPGVVVMDLGAGDANLEPALKGVVADFQYVSSAPPISNLNRSNGEITQTSKAI